MNQLILIVILAFSGAMRLAKADDVCNPNLCKNGGTCQPPDQGYNWGYYCTCRSGYYGAQCQWDSDQCIINTATPCQNGGECIVVQDGRFCKCPGDTPTTIRYGGHYCEIENPCSSCPIDTIYCITAPTVASGRMCLNSGHEKIA